ENSPAIESARRHRLIATFLRFSPTPHWRVTPAPEVTGGTRVEVQDLRFGFRAIATVDATGQVASTSFSF
ncbi:MAG TPA: hypothetical protein VES20_16970, partial [Bryobacteraceae bacterium]|nr:hypothetical protein [Bryobacteraceae bacterium]